MKTHVRLTPAVNYFSDHPIPIPQLTLSITVNLIMLKSAKQNLHSRSAHFSKARARGTPQKGSPQNSTRSVFQGEDANQKVLSTIANSIINRDSKKLREKSTNKSNISIGKVVTNRKKITMPHLCKLIEQIYSANFIRNTMRLKSQRMCGEYVSGGGKIAQFAEVYLSTKERIKRGESLPMLLQGLSYYLQRQPLQNLTIFDKFIAEEYSGEELIFFLFMRSIVEKELKINFVKEFQLKKHIRRDQDIHPLSINRKTVLRIALAIFGTHHMSTQYSASVLKQMDDHLMEKIGIYKLMQIFLSQFHSCKKSQPHESKEETLQQPYREINPNSSILFSDSQECSFWENNHADLSRLKKDQIIAMQDTVMEFLSHLGAQDKQQLYRKLLAKSLTLLACVVGSDKVEWLNSLECVNPGEEDLIEVQEVQMVYRQNARQIYKKILGIKKVREKVIETLSQ